MKKILLGLFLLSGLISRANSGGPDAFGYTWKDSNDPNGQPYIWYDITATGQLINGLGDDNFVGPIQMGFQFPYYWYTESKAWVGSNGYLEFGPGNLAANFPPIPSPGGVNNFVAGIMADMTFLGVGNPGQVYFYANQDTFCLEYLNVPYWDPNSPGYTGSNTFEIILNRADSSITVNFQSYSGFSISNIESGIENNIGTMGLQPLSTQPPSGNYTIKYYYPANVMQVKDASVSWNDNAADGGIFLANNGGTHQLYTQIENSGNLYIDSVIVNAKIKQPPSSILVTSNAITPPIFPGLHTQVQFSNAYTPTTLGTKTFITRISGVGGDTIPVNDSLIQEMVVVDTTLPSIRLSYTENQTNPVLGSISWNGGQGGVGVYIEPPTYPARILNTNFILNFGPTTGPAFYAKIYDDNGPQNSPGTLLDSVLVDGSQIVSNQLLLVPVAGNVVIQSGGFYVNWEMATPSVAIGMDLTPPFSRRTYETFQNIWSTFRDYQTADFFIGADYACSSPEDVGVSSIFSPANNSTVSGPTNVTCWLRNYSTTPDNYFITVNYKLANSATIVSQPYTGPLIPPGDSTLFTFTTQLTPPYSGNDVLYAWTTKTSDVDHNNDTSSVNLSLVSIQEFTQLEGVSVFPVPANEKVSFRFENGTDENLVISITDIAGHVIDVKNYTRASAGSELSIDLSCYDAGTYLYSIRSGDKTGTGRIVKTK